MKNKTRSILDMSNTEARSFFMKDTSYCNIDMPLYFDFRKLLSKVEKALDGKKLSDFKSSDKLKQPYNFDNVNYSFINNKDGKYAWRPFEIIHPAIYVALVNEITIDDNWQFLRNRFKNFAKDRKIKCLSIPIESLTEAKDKASQILHWWQEVEQESIALALDYEYVFHTDITDCYGAIYTHSIAWALHTKTISKSKKKDNALLGNVIDCYIQDMRHGQTNGIPQGSVLMDFIAEMVLGYADTLLSEKLRSAKLKQFRILRYRDDCRIFVNNPQNGEAIIKALTEVMIELGLKLHPSKTRQSAENIILAAVKPDKLSWNKKKQRVRGLQRHSLLILQHAIDYPNSGSLIRALVDFYERIVQLPSCNSIVQLVSIFTNIAINNPKTYPVCAAIISKIISFLPKSKQKSLVGKISKKFKLIPNTGYMEVWLQRATLHIGSRLKFNEPLCQLVNKESVELWNNEWISGRKLKTALKTRIVSDAEIDAAPSVIPSTEFELFLSSLNYQG